MKRFLSYTVVVALFLRTFCDADCGSGASRISVSPLQNGGVIVNPVSGGKYSHNSKCSWYIEGDNRTVSIQLKFTSYEIECLWDRLFVYQGDSLYGSLFASVTGSALSSSVDEDSQYPLALPLAHNEGISGSGEGSGSSGGDDPVPDELIVTVPGSRAFIYFFSDAGVFGRGFNISYWINGCVDNCSNNGVCDAGQCDCDPLWAGSYCQYRKCPNDCSNQGHCDHAQSMCTCNSGYTGTDCSIMEGTSHWSVLKGSDITARSGHSSVTWGDYVWVYGGYRYGDLDENDFTGSGYSYNTLDLVRYHVENKNWEEVPIESSWLPKSRYSHSAIVHNDSMYIYGGALIETEDIVNELWRFDFETLSWTQLSVCNNGSSNITQDSDAQFTSIAGNDNTVLPLPVKYHTANLVNDTMYVIFGYSTVRGSIINYVQLYDIVAQQWSISLPRYTDGTVPNSRMGHTSIHVPLLNSILVYGGGIINKSIQPQDDLLSYSIATNQWSILSSSSAPVLFHSSILLNNSLLLSFGGYNGYTNFDCFSQELLVYNILSDEWFNEDASGLPIPAERLGHSSVNINETMFIMGGYNNIMYDDVLIFAPQDCTVISDENKCNNETFCMWNESECLRINLLKDLDPDFDICSIHQTCVDCTGTNLCYWSNISTCATVADMDTINNNTVVLDASQCEQQPLLKCDQFRDCVSCQASSCVWNNASRCVSSDNDTAIATSCNRLTTSCSAFNSCADCTGTCLWCDSLHKCVDDVVYPESFLYGQCLGWNNEAKNCPAENCSDYNTCGSCHGDPKCGWCRDPSDTGLGVCNEGGYLATLETSLCPDMDWFYDQCPLCNCNGHSSCINKSICENCRDMTTGENCERCVDGFYGIPENGRNCSVCDCNGYNSICNHDNGTCTCLDAGVTGDQCTRCDGIGLYNGEADNFCHYKMSVGFIYTFSVTESRQLQTFYTAVPKSGSKLNVKFDITRNPLNAHIYVQYFIGRVSDDYWLLVNLTEPIQLSGTSSMSDTFESFFSSDNNTDFFTFAHDSIQDSYNFTVLLDSTVPNDYSHDLWGGDIGLVIFVTNQSLSLQYKITIDQNDLLFLAYFFVTFVFCFALLLGIFMLGWFIKRKLERRALIRAQHVELQRRVRRPFSRLKAVIEKNPDLKAKQSASYVSVETCKDNKAAILSLLIRLPGNREAGTPTINRTGIGFGSTLVRMNQNKKDKKKEKKIRHRTAVVPSEEHAI